MIDIPLGSKTQLEVAAVYRNAAYEIERRIVASLRKGREPQTDRALQRRIQQIIDEAENDALNTMHDQLIESYRKGYERDPKRNKAVAVAIGAIAALVWKAKTPQDKACVINSAILYGKSGIVSRPIARARKLLQGSTLLLNTAAVDAIGRTIGGLTNATHTLRFSAREAQIKVVNNAVANYQKGGITWMQAKQQAIDDMRRQGITHFVDRAGRRWQIDTYAEMCVRTGIANASRAGFDQSMEERGIDLVYVSGHPGACPLCVPWEGVVLSRNGDGEHPTVDEAMSAGLFHPNCGHVLFEYIEGFSKLRKYDSPENSELYKNRQKQRAMERDIRKWKRHEATAVDADTKRAAARKVREGQAKIRKFTKENALPRKYYRERVT